MSKGEATKCPVVILSTVGWDFLWQRKQILATLFARAGYPTVYVESLGLANPRVDRGTLRKVLCKVLRAGKGRREPEKGEERLAVYSPLVAPPTAEAFRRLNRRALVPRAARDLRRLADEDPIVVAYPPTRTTIDLLSGLGSRLVLYDCSDNYTGFPGVPEDIDRTEEELLGRADLVSCTSNFLLEKLRPRRSDAFFCGPGVDYALFNRAYRVAEPDAPIRRVCFFGGMGTHRFDFGIVEGLADVGYEVFLIGDTKGECPPLLGHPNVRYMPPVPHAELPSLLRPMDALLIPYKMNELTRGILPAKIYECLATGKPVVATPLPDLKSFRGHLYLAEGPEGFAEVLSRLPELETEEKVRARLGLAAENSWEVRFRAIEEALWQKM